MKGIVTGAPAQECPHSKFKNAGQHAKLRAVYLAVIALIIILTVKPFRKECNENERIICFL